MSNVWFCSDLHLGHKRIGEFRSPMGIKSEEDNKEYIVNDWLAKVEKKDVVYILGDAAFTMDAVQLFGDLPGRKFLIRGNHDQLNTQVYLKYFDEVYGLLKYKEFWLSHAPIHPEELRNKINLHGHVHFHTVGDTRYVNCCMEYLSPNGYGCMINLDQVRKMVGVRSNF